MSYVEKEKEESLAPAYCVKAFTAAILSLSQIHDID